MKRCAIAAVGLTLATVASCATGPRNVPNSAPPLPTGVTAIPLVPTTTAASGTVLPGEPTTTPVPTTPAPTPSDEACTLLVPLLPELQDTFQGLADSPDGSSTDLDAMSTLIADLTEVQDKSLGTTISPDMAAIVTLTSQSYTQLQEDGSVSGVPLKSIKNSSTSLIDLCDL